MLHGNKLECFQAPERFVIDLSHLTRLRNCLAVSIRIEDHDVHTEVRAMAQFPERLPFVHSNRKSAFIEILALDEQGQRRAHFDPGVQYGLYVRSDSEWRLEKVYHNIFEARSAGAKIRRRLQRLAT